jgi:hypothetical protein
MTTVYFDLIKRIKAKVQSEVRVVYDPETGIQKTFLHGKLLGVKKFIPNRYRIQGEQNEGNKGT